MLIFSVFLFRCVATIGVPAKRRGGGGGGALRSGAAALDFRTLDVFGKRAARSAATGELNDRAVCVHPSSVLAKSKRFERLVRSSAAAADAAAAAAAAAGAGARGANGGAPPQAQRKKESSQRRGKKKAPSSSAPAALHLVFFGRLKTSRVFLTDATVVGPLPVLLFGAALQTTGASPEAGAVDSAAQGGAQVGGGRAASAPVLVTVDGWIEYRMTQRGAAALGQLRSALGALVARCVGGCAAGGAGGGDAAAALLGALLQAHGGGDYDRCVRSILLFALFFCCSSILLFATTTTTTAARLSLRVGALRRIPRRSSRCTATR